MIANDVYPALDGLVLFCGIAHVENNVGRIEVDARCNFLSGVGISVPEDVTSNDASKLIDGQAQYSCLPNENGGIVDDLIVYKMKDNDYMIVVNASNIEKDWNWISKFNSKGVAMKNISAPGAV